MLLRLRLDLFRGRLVRRRYSTDVKPFYVTTPIFYPNARPHVGHLHSLLTADILARFQRILSPARPVVFLTGTDEHGLKMQQAAEAKGLDPLAFCDAISAEFRVLAERANISGSMFVRTTQPQHRATVEHVWRTLADEGLIYKDTYEGYYSTVDECFYPPTRVAPHPTLPDTHVATETGSIVAWSREVNYKFRLSRFRAPLLAHYAAHRRGPGTEDDGSAPRGVCPDVYQNAVVQELATELEDLSISRPRERIAWGIPVPDDPSQTVYVWFDALLIYLSGAVGDNAWPPDVQVIGKDILRFHAVYLPAILQAMKMPLPKTLLTHAHWTAGQKKMSKSLGNVADPLAAMDTYGVDPVRFYLARVGGRFQDDVDWSEEQLRKHADEIRNALGNYFLRVTSKAIKRRAANASSEALTRELFDGVDGSNATEVDLETCKLSTNQDLLRVLDGLCARVTRAMTHFEVADALHAIVLVLKHANGLLTTLEPWSGSPDLAMSCYLTALETLRITAILLQPFTPHTSARLLDGLHIPADERHIAYARVGKSEIGRMDVDGIKLFEYPSM